MSLHDVPAPEESNRIAVPKTGDVEMVSEVGANVANTGFIGGDLNVAVKIGTPDTGSSTDDEALQRVVALSDATAADCDLLVHAPTGLRLRLTDVYVERELEQVIVETLRPGSLTALRGEAGYGKTVLMWRLHQRLTQAGRLALLVPATALLRGARGDRDSAAVTVDDLWGALHAAVRAHRAPVLLVDTVDLLTHSVETRVEVRRLMRTAVECRVPMVVACRPAEAALLHLDVEETDPFRVPVRPLQLRAFNERERREAIEAYAWSCYGEDADDIMAVVHDAQVRGRPLREVVANPLTLRMLFELYAGDQEHPDPDIDSIALYTLMWDRRVITDTRDRATPRAGPDLSVEAERTSLAMLACGRIELTGRELVDWLSGSRPVEESIALLVARAILTLREETQRLWFWHQTWFEYTAARAVARLGPNTASSLAEFVVEAPYDLFFGEVASQLILLAGRTAEMSVALAEELLTAWLRVDEPGVRVLALRTYARFREPSPTLRAAAASALTSADDRTCKDFLRLLPTVSHPTPDRWLADLSVVWTRERLRLEVIEALTRLAATEPALAVAFVIEYDCIGWLLERPIAQWRDHDSLHLRLLAAVAPDNQRWVAHQAMRFWQPLAEAGTVTGLGDIAQFLVQRGRVRHEHYQTISATLRGLDTTDRTLELQRAYADMVILAGDTPADLDRSLDAIMADPEAGEAWRRAMLRGVGRTVFTLTAPAEVDRHVKRLLSPAAPEHLNYHATAVAELLSGPPATPLVPPVTEHIRQLCRSVLHSPDQQPALTALFVAAIQYARLDGATLLKVLPDDTVNHSAWFSMDPHGVLLVEAAAVGNTSANAALRWSITDEGRAQVPPHQLRKLVQLLRKRVENAPRLLTHIVSIAHINLDSSTMCDTVDRLPADITSAQPDVVDTILDTRTQLVNDAQPHRRTKGYILWRALVRNSLDEPPSPDDLAATLETSRYDSLVKAIIGLGIESIEHDAWPEQSASRLTEIAGRMLAGRGNSHHEKCPYHSNSAGTSR